MRSLNQKVLGSFVVGLGLVAASYTYVNFGKPRSSYPVYQQEAASIRSAIAVTDTDNNGIEDWRDTFTNEPIIIGEPFASYTPPTTATGKLGVSLFEDYVRMKTYGPFAQTKEELVTNTVSDLSESTEQVLYGIRDVQVLTSWRDEDIRNYMNAMATIILNNNKAGMDDELTILYEIVTNGKKERTGELSVIASTYKDMRDQSLLIPVPEKFLKEHLDLINTYEAIYQDISAMSFALEDPIVALMRIKRYQEDALGFQLALENMYLATEPHTQLFSSTDPAMIFSYFNSSAVNKP